MIKPPGTPENPLRVAIVGSGPAGFYAAEKLLKAADLSVEVEMFERLPTPWGLVRAGVAPDHPNIKAVTRVYEKTAALPGFQFHGNVEIGVHLSHEELATHYHAALYAIGSPTDRGFGGALSFRYVTIDETVSAFKELIDGNLDEIPEQAFLYCGGLDDVREKAKKLQAVA